MYMITFLAKQKISHIKRLAGVNFGPWSQSCQGNDKLNAARIYPGSHVPLKSTC